MSFSLEVKEELGNHYGTARHCRLAELAVLMRSYVLIEHSNGDKISLIFRTEHEGIARKYFTLLRKTFNIDTVVVGETAKNAVFTVTVDDCEQCERILDAVKFSSDSRQKGVSRNDIIHPVLLKTQCCKRAFLRGTYLCNGSMSDPTKGYHLEFVCNTQEQAVQIKEVIADFLLESKVVIRKGKHVVYIKEAETIVELLNIMEAHQSLMNLENTRILKDIGNRINRGVNCDAANIRRIAEAATKQKEDILYLMEHGGFSALSDGLQQVALIRLEDKYISLQDIGAQLDPPVGKSGVNHRLRKISEAADRMRLQGGEKHGSEKDDNSTRRRS